MTDKKINEKILTGLLKNTKMNKTRRSLFDNEKIICHEIKIFKSNQIEILEMENTIC